MDGRMVGKVDDESKRAIACPNMFTHASLLQVSTMLLSKEASGDANNTNKDPLKAKIDLDDELCQLIYAVHKTLEQKYFTPRRYLMLLETYRHVFLSKQRAIVQRQQHLKSGVSKLSDARKVVDDLKRTAEVKQRELAVKQHEADDALKQITKSMSVSGGTANRTALVRIVVLGFVYVGCWIAKNRDATLER